MAETLYLRIIGDQLEWLVQGTGTSVAGEGGQDTVRLRGRGTDSDFESLMAEMHWSGMATLIVPGEDVLLTTARVPSKQQRQILQAIPYVIEEELARDVEDCHFAVGLRDPDGVIPVAVVDRAKMVSWVERMQALGLHVSRVVPDTLMVPFGTVSEGVHGVIDHGRAVLRTSEYAGLVVETDLLADTLALIPNAEQIILQVHPTERGRLDMAVAQLEAGGTCRVEVHELESEPFEALTRGGEDAINLLQGEFRVADERGERQTGWQSAAVLVACAFGLHVMLTLGQGIYMDVKAKQYEAEALALYAEVFPDDTNVRDIRRRWQAHLGGSSDTGSGEFFAVFSETARHLPGSQLELRNVNFNESRGDLILQLNAPASEHFVAYAQKLSSEGLEAEVGTINQDEDVARGSIKVRISGG